jgi:Fur family ferric uptake transcriptional regulator
MLELRAPEDMLREVRLRVTRPRVAVLTAVHAHPHADTDTLAGIVRSDLGTVSTQAVYDALAALTTAGLVRRIKPAGSPSLYEARVGDNHHHIVCRSCGTIADVDSRSPSRARSAPRSVGVVGHGDARIGAVTTRHAPKSLARLQRFSLTSRQPRTA